MYIQSIDVVLKGVHDEVHKNNQNLVEYKNKFKAIARGNCKKI